jgi:hypothetical protein
MKSVLSGQQKIKFGNELHSVENKTEIMQNAEKYSCCPNISNEF